MTLDKFTIKAQEAVQRREEIREDMLECLEMNCEEGRNVG